MVNCMHAICAYFQMDAINVFQNIGVRGIKRLERMCTWGEMVHFRSH